VSRTGSWALALIAAIALAALAVIAAFGPRRPRARKGASAQPHTPLPADIEGALEAALAEASRKLLDALQRGDPQAYADQFAIDGLSMPGLGPVVRGRDAIAAAMTQTFYRIRFLQTDSSQLDVRLNGETALETGSYHYVVAANRTGIRRTLRGRYVIAWKRVAGEWKIALEAAQPEAVGEVSLPIDPTLTY